MRPKYVKALRDMSARLRSIRGRVESYSALTKRLADESTS
jgi:hypothetical protein